MPDQTARPQAARGAAATRPARGNRAGVPPRLRHLLGGARAGGGGLAGAPAPPCAGLGALRPGRLGAGACRAASHRAGRWPRCRGRPGRPAARLAGGGALVCRGAGGGGGAAGGGLWGAPRRGGHAAGPGRAGAAGPLATGPLAAWGALLVAGFTAASLVGEELGWRGYALPALQARYSAAGASLILGIMWGAWHLPMALAPATGSAAVHIPLAWYLLDIVGATFFYTWVYNSTGGSLLLATLIHTAGNVVSYYLPVATLSEGSGTGYLVLVALRWGVAGLLVWRAGGATLSAARQKQPLLCAGGAGGLPRLGAPFSSRCRGPARRSRAGWQARVLLSPPAEHCAALLCPAHAGTTDARLTRDRQGATASGPGFAHSQTGIGDISIMRSCTSLRPRAILGSGPAMRSSRSTM